MKEPRKLTIKAFYSGTTAMLVGAMFAAPAIAQTSAEASATQSAQTDEQAGEIVVTANRREESAQRVGIAVSSFTGDSLDARGVVDTIGLGSITPGLVIASAGGA